MKIIKEGKRIMNAKVRVTCENCDAVLEITRNDLAKCPDEPGKPSVYQITCPCCKKKSYFTEGELAGIF